jgi:hypothetical protein
MATLACEYRRARSTATCPMRGCVWTIQTRGDTLSGIAERPPCRCQRSITWAADLSCRSAISRSVGPSKLRFSIPRHAVIPPIGDHAWVAIPCCLCAPAGAQPFGVRRRHSRHGSDGQEGVARDSRDRRQPLEVLLAAIVVTIVVPLVLHAAPPVHPQWLLSHRSNPPSRRLVGNARIASALTASTRMAGESHERLVGGTDRASSVPRTGCLTPCIRLTDSGIPHWRC